MVDTEKMVIYDFNNISFQGESSINNCFGCDSCDCNCDCDSGDCDCNSSCDSDW